MTKAAIEEKIRSGKCRHEIKTVGTPAAGKYVTKYVAGLKTETVVTEVRIYADEQGKFNILPQYRSGVTYGENVKALAAVLYGEGVMANDRIAAFLNFAGGDVLGFRREVFTVSAKGFLKMQQKALHIWKAAC